MILDTHLHIMLKPFYGRPPTDPAKLLADLAECGLDGGWVSSVDGMVTRDLNVQRRANDALARIARDHPGRIEGFCTVDPGAGDEAAREIERCVKQLHLIGVKLHPWLQAFSVTHPGMDPVMTVAGDLHIPVLFHDGTPPYSTPRQIGWLAERHPKTTVILGHSGLADMWRDAADVARLTPNVWLQPTSSPPVAIRAALAGAGPDRILFGSDGGFGSPALIRFVIAKFRAALGAQLFNQAAAHNPARLQAQSSSAAPPRATT